MMKTIIYILSVCILASVFMSCSQKPQETEKIDYNGDKPSQNVSITGTVSNKDKAEGKTEDINQEELDYLTYELNEQIQS